MDIGTEQASALCGHEIQSSENVLGQFIIFVTGHPNGDIDEINQQIKLMLARSIIDNRDELGKLVSSLHVKLDYFDPEEFFGAINSG